MHPHLVFLLPFFWSYGKRHDMGKSNDSYLRTVPSTEPVPTNRNDTHDTTFSNLFPHDLVTNPSLLAALGKKKRKENERKKEKKFSTVKLKLFDNEDMVYSNLGLMVVMRVDLIIFF